MKDKKIIIVVLGLFVSILSLTPTKAYHSDNEIIFDDSYTIMDALNDYQNGKGNTKNNLLKRVLKIV